MAYVNTDIGRAYFTLQHSTLIGFWRVNGKHTKAVVVEPLYYEVINLSRWIMSIILTLYFLTIKKQIIII